MGDFYPLNIRFNSVKLNEELSQVTDGWKPYNISKPLFKREGLSLFSLDGSSSGEIDLNSIGEYNKQNGTQYDELDFNTPTEYWKTITSLSSKLHEIEGSLGRSHLLRFDIGGFFPPHRDLGNSFRLIAFFDCSPISLFFHLEDKKLFFERNRLYFLNTKKEHAIFSFFPNAVVLVLNVSLEDLSIRFVYDHLLMR